MTLSAHLTRSQKRASLSFDPSLELRRRRFGLSARDAKFFTCPTGHRLEAIHVKNFASRGKRAYVPVARDVRPRIHWCPTTTATM